MSSSTSGGRLGAAAHSRRWWIVAGIFLVLTVSSGFSFYNMSVYINVLAAERGFSVADLSMVVSAFFVVGGVAGMLVARLIERHDVRWVMVGGCALGAAALGSVGAATQLWQLHLLFALFGIGNSAVSIVTATTLITRWFPGRDRSVALSIASTGLSAGGIVLTPLSARLLHEFGVALTMPWFGVAFFVLVVPVVLAIVRDREPPEAPDALGTATAATAWTYRAALRTRFFVLLTLAYVLCLGFQVGGIAHLYNRAAQLADYRVAAYAVQALTVCSILGRFLGGWLVTRVAIRPFTLGNLVNQGIGFCVLALAHDPVTVLAGAALFGASVGNLLMLHPLWLAEAFGGPAYARIFALSNALTVLGVALGPTLMGLVFEAADYRLAYLTAAAGAAAALLLMAAAGRGPGRPSPDPSP